MNKYKKLAVAAVSLVMAGTMVASLAACGPANPTPGPDPNGGGGQGFVADSDAVTSTKPDHISKASNGQTKLTPTTDASGHLSYAAGTTLNIGIGYNNAQTGTKYDTKNAESLTGHTLMGNSISANTFKPAWAALQSQLGVTFNDVYNSEGAGTNLGKIKDSTEGLAGTTIFTASASTINQEGMSNRESLLDLNDYLEYMPNFKAFLEKSPIIQASLIADANSGAMYMAPYFDGNDDIEKFVLMRKDLVETLLDGVSGETLSTVTFKAQADAKNNATVKPVKPIVGTSSSVTSFMGTTGSWTVEATDPAVLTGTPAIGSNKDEVSDVYATVLVKVDYDKALADAKSDAEGSIGAVLATVTGVEDEDIAGLESGNIVDIMNVAINASAGEVTGGQLLQILRRYIDVAYTTEDGSASFYASSNHGLKRSDVFNGASAAWDADLYAALGRVFVTCGSMLGSEVSDVSLLYLIAGREYTTQRTTDVASLAGELYGIRGLESRYNYTYITEDGEVMDARSKENTFTALSKIYDLAQEGLFNTANNITNNNASHSGSGNGKIQTLTEHDYVQTQTSAVGFNGTSYNFAPILTPVSAWNVDGDPTTAATGRSDGKETIMRFTESWRGVKDGGFVISYDAVKNNPDTLAAALAFVDYFFSVDGQILMTYGPQSTNGNTNPNGLWYATEATGISVESIATKVADATSYAPAQWQVNKANQGQYFVYNGKVYTGTYYNGRQIPTLTSENLNVFNNAASHNFTNHARQFLGTCFPLGNKDQGFEYQCTAPCGIVGSNIVNIALVNGTVKHQVQSIELDAEGRPEWADSMWYTLVPTQLPYNSAVTETLGSTLRYISGLGADNENLYVSTSKTTRNLLLDIMYNGFDSSVSVEYVATEEWTLPGSAAAAVTLNKNAGLNQLTNYKRVAWFGLLDWYYDSYAA